MSVPRLGLGRLIPILLVVVFSADVLARFAPLDPLCFQAWECVTRYQEPGAIFEANRRFESARTHGNLSNMGNLPRLREDRPQVFTTDARGFRNAPAVGSGPLDGIVLGDSFAAGYGITDDDTLAVRLSADTALNFYNAGGPYAYVATARTLQQTLPLRAPNIVIVWTESVSVPAIAAAEATAVTPDRRTQLLTSVFGSDGARYRSVLRGLWFTSPLKVAAQKVFLRLSDDTILPNVYSRNVVQRRLVNGRTMLFYPPDVADFHRRRDPAEVIAHLSWIAAELRRSGMTPVVLLAPSKYTVYYPLLATRDREPGDARHPLARVGDALRAHGIPAIDLTAVFRQRAAEEIQQGRYLYWLDDTHWNGRGVAVASAFIRDEWFAPRHERDSEIQ